MFLRRLTKHHLSFDKKRAIVAIRVMASPLHLRPDKASGVLGLLICAFAVLMLLTFPIRSAHQYANHLRSPEVRRSSERHTSIAYSNFRPAEVITYPAVLPTLLAPVEAGNTFVPAANTELLPSAIPISRLLLRLKLGCSRSGSQDPLL
jgi:hypothetical protein